MSEPLPADERVWSQDEIDADMGNDYELDEFEEAMYDCHGHFDEPGPGGLFQCGAVGSEDCDECPMHRWLGLTNRQIDRLEETDE